MSMLECSQELLISAPKVVGMMMPAPWSGKNVVDVFPVRFWIFVDELRDFQKKFQRLLFTLEIVSFLVAFLCFFVGWTLQIGFHPFRR
jgi:hypothetical protein